MRTPDLQLTGYGYTGAVSSATRSPTRLARSIRVALFTDRNALCDEFIQETADHGIPIRRNAWRLYRKHRNCARILSIRSVKAGPFFESARALVPSGSHELAELLPKAAYSLRIPFRTASKAERTLISWQARYSSSPALSAPRLTAFKSRSPLTETTQSESSNAVECWA